MNRKSLIILILAIIVISSIFIVNAVVAKKIAKSVDQQLQTLLSENDPALGLQFDYGQVNANPIGRSVTITDFKMRGIDPYDIDIEASQVKLKTSLSEILSLAGNSNLKSLRELSIDLQNPIFKSEESQPSFTAKSMKILFNGEVSPFEIERIDNGILPSTKQSVALHFQDMGWENVEELMQEVPDEVRSILGSNYNQSGNFSFALAFDPYKKQIHLTQWEINNRTTSASGNAFINFVGDSFDEFEPKDGHVEMEYKLGKIKESYPELGEYSLKKFNLGFELDLDFESVSNGPSATNFLSSTPIKSLTYRMNAEGLKLAPSESLNNTISQFDTSAALNALSMKKMALEFEMSEGKMELGKLEVKVDDLVDLTANAIMSYQVLPGQGLFGEEAEVLVFDNAYLEVRSQSKSIDDLIEMLEVNLPKPFPRKNGKTIIDMSGPVDNPTIKGVND